MIEKGDIWLIDFNPIIGKEQGGMRPALVVSGNTMNSNFSLSIVCPLTTSEKKFSGNITLKPSIKNNLDKKSQVLIFHIKSVSHKRFVKKIGVIESQELEIIQLNINKLLRY